MNPALPLSILALAAMLWVAWGYFRLSPRVRGLRILTAIGRKSRTKFNGSLTGEKPETGIATSRPFDPSELTPELRDKILRGLKWRLREEFALGFEWCISCGGPWTPKCRDLYLCDRCSSLPVLEAREGAESGASGRSKTSDRTGGSIPPTGANLAGPTWQASIDGGSLPLNVASAKPNDDGTPLVLRRASQSLSAHPAYPHSAELQQPGRDHQLRLGSLLLIQGSLKRI